MSRPLRIQYPGALVHITTRGNNKQNTFLNDRDRVTLLEMLGDATRRFDWILYAHVLMTNHFHLLLELSAPTLSTGMKWLNGKYAQLFNKRHDRVGHLFQSRFHSKLIEKETYFLNVLRYTVLNPVRAQMVRSPDEYEWSSFRATAGLTIAPEWLDVGRAVASFGQPLDLARARYTRWVMDGIAAERSPWSDLIGRTYLGSEQWVSEIRERINSEPRNTEHPRSQRLLTDWRANDAVIAVSRGLAADPLLVRSERGGKGRMLAAWIGTYDCQLTQSSMAAGLRLRSASQVSRLVRRCEESLKIDAQLQDDLRRCRAALYRA